MISAVDAVVDRIVASDARAVALLGLSFKMQTDDLRESPNVTLAETLLGKGFEVRIYDPIVKHSRLTGVEPPLHRRRSSRISAGCSWTLRRPRSRARTWPSCLRPTAR